MYEPLLVGVVKTPGKLNGDVETAIERFFVAAVVELARLNPFLQIAARDILSEHPWNAAQTPHVITTYRMRMHSQVDPGLRFRFKVLDGMFLGEDLGSRALHCQIDVPTVVANLIDLTHASFAKDAGYFVKIENLVTDIPIDGNVSLVGVVCSCGTRCRRWRLFFSFGRRTD